MQPSRDILHRIVAQCLDSAVRDYCVWCPAPLRGQCALDDDCRRTTEVWAQTDEYVVIRDIKMCGCPANFVHGLAMARTSCAARKNRSVPPASGHSPGRSPTSGFRRRWRSGSPSIPLTCALRIIFISTREPKPIACRAPGRRVGRCGASCCGAWAPELPRDCRARVRRQLSGRSRRRKSGARVHTVSLSIDAGPGFIPSLVFL